MSYILDALKRAESERSRGAVPNIHAQPATTGGDDGSRPVTLRVGYGLIAVAVVVVAMGAGLAWWGLAGDTSTSPPTLAAVAPAPLPAMPVAPAARPSAAALPVPWQPRPTVLPAPLNLPLRKPAVAVPSASALASPVRIEKPGSASSATMTAGTSASMPAAVAPAAEERVYALKDLPDDIRNSLPVLTVGGATYSENAANRMLIVNGALFHEGDKLTPEVTLQQIKLRTAVLSFRGYRYGINY